MLGLVAAYWKQIEARGWGKRTTVVVYSEFGRRVEENASVGTDHGTAGPVLVLGAGVRRGFHFQMPSLCNLDDGDLRHSVDFRSLYATLLEDWLEVPSRPLLGGTYERLRLFGS